MPKVRRAATILWSRTSRTPRPYRSGRRIPQCYPHKSLGLEPCEAECFTYSLAAEHVPRTKCLWRKISLLTFRELKLECNMALLLIALPRTFPVENASRQLHIEALEGKRRQNMAVTATTTIGEQGARSTSGRRRKNTMLQKTRTW